MLEESYMVKADTFNAHYQMLALRHRGYYRHRRHVEIRCRHYVIVS